MTIIEMLEQSGVLALLGMGIVFSFLVILVAAISISSVIIRKFEKPAPAVITPMGSSAGANEEIAAVITAAVNEFRKNN